MFTKLKIGIVLTALVVLTTFPQYAQEAEYVAPKVAAVNTTPPPAKSIPQLVEKYALEYGVSSTTMMQVIKCESGFNPKAVGDNGTSYGLAQIHLPAWPHVTVAQATNPEFAIKFMAEQMSRGNARAWTCYRMITT